MLRAFALRRELARPIRDLKLLLPLPRPQKWLRLWQWQKHRKASVRAQPGERYCVVIRKVRDQQQFSRWKLRVLIDPSDVTSAAVAYQSQASKHARHGVRQPAMVGWLMG